MARQSDINNVISIVDLTIGYRTAKKNIFSYGPVNSGIMSGDMTAIIGHNGIGKSSLLRTLSALQNPLSGKIYYYGTENAGYSRQQLSRMISFVSTEHAGLFNISVNEMVAMGRYPYTNWIGTLKYDDQLKVDQAVEQTNIGHIREKYIYQLSDGERQKTMIARALAQDTPVIILDEPTAFLDLPSRHDLLRMLGNLTRTERKTIIFSTHDLDIAMQEADKIWLMTDSGIFEGAPEDLLINELFSKLFINSSFYYDRKSDGFRLRKELRGNISLDGSRESIFYTGKALERIGFKWTTDTGSAITINIMTGHGNMAWHLSTPDTEMKFDNIYSLTRFLREQEGNP